MSSPLSRPCTALVALAVAAAVWVLSGATFHAAKIEIKTQHDETFSFAGLRTWNWSPNGKGEVKLVTTAEADPQRLRDQVEPVIVPVVEQELPRRGFTRTADTPDVLVNYFVLVTIGQSSQYMGQFIGTPEWGLPPFMASTTALRAFPVGTLLIDVVAPSRQAIVWRGAAQAEIDLDRKPEERRVRLEQAVRDILKRFPPKDKKKD